MNEEELRKLLASFGPHGQEEPKPTGVSVLTREQMVPVNSGWAAFVLYHPDTQELEVEALTAEYIVYPSVSREEYEALFRAPSVYKYCCALGRAGDRGYRVIKRLRSDAVDRDSDGTDAVSRG